MPPCAASIAVPFHTPKVIVPTPAVLNNVPEVGKVTFVVPVVVSVNG